MKATREIKIESKNAKVVLEMTVDQITRERVLDGQATGTYETVQINDFRIELHANGKRMDYNSFFRNDKVKNQVYIGKYTIAAPEIVAEIVAAYTELMEIKAEEIASWEKVLTQEEKQEIKKAEQIIVEVEKIGEKNLRTYKEEMTWRKQYNDINNESGYGYIPNNPTKESYKWAKEIMERA